MRDAAAIRQLAPHRRIFLQQFRDARRRNRKAGMRPDDLGARIVRKQNQQRFLVAMGVQIEVALNGEVDRLLDPGAGGGLAGEMEFADAAVIAAFVFALDQIEDRRIVEPCLDVGAHPVGPDERHHPEARRFRLDQLMRALVGTAGGEDTGDVVAAEQLQHLVERIERRRLLIVMQVRVEDLDLLLEFLRARRGKAEGAQRDEKQCSAPSPHGRARFESIRYLDESISIRSSPRKRGPRPSLAAPGSRLRGNERMRVVQRRLTTFSASSG